MPFQCLHDRDELEGFLSADPILHLYSLGDLDPAFWPHTCWYGLREEDRLAAVMLVYLGLGLPAVQLFTGGDADPAAHLLEEVLPILPARFHAHLGPPELEPVLRRQRAFSPYGLSLRMRLATPEHLAGADPDGLVILDAADEPAIRALLAVAYPHNFFEPRMLASGLYLGVRRGGDLLAMAGLHVQSERYRAAALGNVATHPAHRGQGLGRAVTAALGRRLLARGIDRIGLNVREANRAGRALYEGLGFVTHLRYQEGLAGP
ncbi:MAG: GNAT family N-acetyltransferase [Pseudomonadota bacterium]